MRRWLVPAALTLAAGCGGSDGAALESVSVDGGEYAYVMPDEIEGGVVSMRFRNIGKKPHEFAFGRIDGGHTIDETIRDLFASDGNVPYSKDLGGVPLLSPGAEVTITRTLAPGTYGFLCFVPNAAGELHLKLGMKRQFRVVGDSGAELPDPDAVITATKTGFDVPAIEAGRRTIELRNESGEDREWNLTVYGPGKTSKDVDTWANNGFKDDAPATFYGAMQSIPSGTSVFLTLELEIGKTYVLEDLDADIRAEIKTPRQRFRRHARRRSRKRGSLPAHGPEGRAW